MDGVVAQTFGMTSRTSTAHRPRRFAITVHRGVDPSGAGPFYEALLAGMEEELDRHGATIFLQLVDSSEEELGAYQRWADERVVDGVVVTDLLDDDDRAATCRSLGLPVVTLGEPAEDDVPHLEVDNSGAMVMAVETLADAGHRVIAHVSGPVRLRHTRARTEAFREVVARRGVAGVSVEGDYTSASGADRTRELLAADERPTAIVYDNDLMAVAGLQVASTAGLEVPRELSLLAWDDSPICRLSSPPLSAISRAVHDLGEQLARVLLDAESGRFTSVQHAPQAGVVHRGTTAAPPR
jgi:DNA-binding LacI/PurR family transcriptional regulator